MGCLCVRTLIHTLAFTKDLSSLNSKISRKSAEKEIMLYVWTSVSRGPGGHRKVKCFLSLLIP